jgi:hypothetical protein
MKRLSNVLLIFVTLILCFVLFLLSFTLLKYYTSIELVSFKVVAEIFAIYTTPLIGLLGALLVWRSFKAQLTANQIQIDALKIETDRYKIDKGYDRIINLMQEVQTSKDALKILLNTPDLDKTRGSECIRQFNQQINFAIANNYQFDNLGIINLSQFSESMSQFLQITKLTADYIFQYYGYSDNSFLILKSKFFKTIGDLLNDLEEIHINRSKIDNLQNTPYYFLFLIQEIE